MTFCCNTKKTDAMLNRMLSVKQLLELQHELNNHLSVGKGWTSVISIDQFKTAIIDEASELLGSGVQWKWWGSPVDPENYDLHNVRIEVTDIVHFWLSISILRYMASTNGYEVCRSDNPYEQFDPYYVGSDMGNTFFNIGLVHEPNVLNHTNFVSVLSNMLCENEQWDVYGWIDTLDILVSSVGMSAETFSAYYTAKSELNAARWDIRVTSGEYEKVVDGVEDNEKLEPLIQAFLDDETMTLEQLRVSVFNEFYEPV